MTTQRTPILLRRLFSSESEEITKTLEFIRQLGYEDSIAQGVVTALLSPKSGVDKGSLLKTVKTLAGAYEIGEDAGLVPLIKSVELSFLEQQGKEQVTFIVTLPTSKQEQLTCEGLEGMTLKDVAEFGTDENSAVLGEYLECACNGIMACSTCHVYVSPLWVEKLSKVCPVTDEELDMIELAYKPQQNSRLGCQIRLSRAVSGLQVTIPADSYNLFDHIPFKD